MKTLLTLAAGSLLFIGTFIGAGVAHAAPLAANQSISQGFSRNWSGYIANSGTYTGITGTWVVPSVAATTTTTADAAWVGIGGATTTDLIQVGTQEITQNNAITYQAWYETLPNVSTIIPVTINPGNSVTGTLTEQSSNNWLITLTNNTTGQTYSTTVTYSSSLASAEWIEEMPSDTSSNFVPLDSFGSVSFTNAHATVNGTNETLLATGAYPLTMETTSQQSLATVSGVGSDGQSFTVSRTNVSSGQSSHTVTVRHGHSWRGGEGCQKFTHTTGTSTHTSSSHASSTESHTNYSARSFKGKGFNFFHSLFSLSFGHK